MKRLLGAVTIVAVTILSVTAAHLEPVRTGVVTALHGTVTVTRSAAKAIPLRFRDDVYPHDRIVTGDRSLARILMGGKAVVTIREHSVLTITEIPGTSTIDLAGGGIAVAVAHEKMRPGESVEIKTRNGIAGIRGTVVIAEVSEVSGGSREVTTTFTVLRGIVDVRLLDPTTRPGGASVITLNALQSIGIRPRVPAHRVTLTPDAARQSADTFKLAPTDVPVGPRAGATDADFREAARQADALISDSRGKMNGRGDDEGAGRGRLRAKAKDDDNDDRRSWARDDRGRRDDALDGDDLDKLSRRRLLDPTLPKLKPSDLRKAAERAAESNKKGKN